MSSKLVLSLSDTRLTGLEGHTVVVQGGKPRRIPQALYLEAAARGCVDYNPEMIEAFQKAQQSLEADAAPPRASAPAISIEELTRAAVAVVVDRNDEDDFTGQGQPRVSAVRTVLETLLEERNSAGLDYHLNAKMIFDIAEDLKQPAEDADGEVGDLGEALERVRDHED